MKDPRRLVGLHDYQERHTPDTHPPSTEGLYLECARCGSRRMRPQSGCPGIQTERAESA